MKAKALKSPSMKSLKNETQNMYYHSSNMIFQGQKRHNDLNWPMGEQSQFSSFTSLCTRLKRGILSGDGGFLRLSEFSTGFVSFCRATLPNCNIAHRQYFTLRTRLSFIFGWTTCTKSRRIIHFTLRLRDKQEKIIRNVFSHNVLHTLSRNHASFMQARNQHIYKKMYRPTL